MKVLILVAVMIAIVRICGKHGLEKALTCALQFENLTTEAAIVVETEEVCHVHAEGIVEHIVYSRLSCVSWLEARQYEDLNEILGVELREGDVGDIYPLGKSINCPIKIEFNSNLKKKEVLTNCNKLKGRNISIANDLTHTQRSENKILRKHLFLAKQEGNYRDCYIRRDRLFVDGISYGVEDLEKEDYPETKHNSAPSTPIVEPLEKVSTDLRKGPSTPKTSVAKKTVPPIYKPVPEKPRTRSINKNQ
ncbi:hypothetical protein JTB14_001527 [Gonioctena quinquepunctata]|nr:hypothetical protein JTB14_001527 [Gonioctena quinquepunctata]